MEYILAMTFLTESGSKSTMSISGVKADLTQEQAFALMDTIIEKNIFITKTGSFVKKSAAQLTERKITKYEVANA